MNIESQRICAPHKSHSASVVRTYTCASSAQVHQHSRGLVDLTAVIDSTACQHHSHTFTHLCRVKTLIYSLECPQSQ